MRSWACFLSFFVAQNHGNAVVEDIMYSEVTWFKSKPPLGLFGFFCQTADLRANFSL